jgi:hypothetical protein
MFSLKLKLILEQLKNFVITEKEKYKKLSEDDRFTYSTKSAYLDFSFTLSDVISYIEKIEKENIVDNL